MFSGIVEERAVVRSVTPRDGGAVLSIRSELDHSGTRLGDSISIDGVCLTVVSCVRDPASGWAIEFELAAETVRRSTLGQKRGSDEVNLERALLLGTRLHGHLVFGHVDEVIYLRSSRPDGNSVRMEWSLSPAYRPYLASKGSVAISGVSLTVGEVDDESFSVYIVPHTSSVTTLDRIAVGSSANMEIDMLARYVVSALQTAGLPNSERPAVGSLK